MADSEVIKEFLVSLGFSTNEAQQRKFIDAIEGATTRAILLSKAIEEGAKKIAGAIGDTASEFTHLGLLSQRLHTSAVNIKAFEEAFERIGGTKGDAEAVINALDSAMKDPSRKSILSQWIDTSKDLVTQARELGAAMIGQNDAVKNWMAGVAGISLQQRELLENVPKVSTAMNQATESMTRSGITQDMIDKETEFGTKLTLIQNQIGDIVSGAIMKVTTEKLQGPLDQFETWLQKNQPGITQQLADIGDSLADLLLKGDLTQGFDLLIVALDGVNLALDLAVISVNIIKEGMYEISHNFEQSPGYKEGMDKATKQFDEMLAKNHTTAWKPNVPLHLHDMGDWAKDLWRKGQLMIQGNPVSSSNPLPVTIMAPETMAPGEDGGSGGIFGRIGSAMSRLLGGGQPTDSLGDVPHATSAEGKARANDMLNHLMEKYGLTKDQATGALGVMGYESGDFTTMQEGGKAPGHGGWGYAQWTGPRRRDFMAFAKEHGLDPASPEANKQFFDFEATGKYAFAIERLKRTQGVPEAADSFLTNFEGMQEGGPGIRAGAAHIARAQAYARDPGIGVGLGVAGPNAPVKKSMTSNPVTSVVVHGADTHADADMIGTGTERANENRYSFGTTPVH